MWRSRLICSGDNFCNKINFSVSCVNFTYNINVFFNNNQAEAFESDDVTITLYNVKKRCFGLWVFLRRWPQQIHKLWHFRFSDRHKVFRDYFETKYTHTQEKVREKVLSTLKWRPKNQQKEGKFSPPAHNKLNNFSFLEFGIGIIPRTPK